ncbi:hypothetical protein PV327_006285 [Microctonus hyperodae]|uniref:Exosome complex component RRP45 n=1 Tax=Microctonus hyperodae TaxID=165561 RepID=A0AA39F3Z8_MICHY|nr:hypothetical protein PV327_006285 [Microctonus hyperodae]
MKEIIISRCEREFINKALALDTRLDGRKLLEARKLKLNFGSNWGCCMASLGLTKVVANVSCDIQQPKLSRPNEGMIHINVELNPLAAPHFESGRQSEMSVLMTRQLEKCFKDSKCVDLESLCIVADKKVWNIRVDVNVINHDGNLVDCACIATLAALSHFHRPDVTSTGDGIIIHPFNEKDPLPLTLFHHPVCVSFATFENGKTVMDPTYLEERLGVAQLTMGLNSYRELCCLHFDHTTRSGVATDVVSTVMNNAANYAVDLLKQIRESVKIDVKARYNKETVKDCRFNDTIAKDKITSMISERIQIKLARWNAANSYDDLEDNKNNAMVVDEHEDLCEVRDLGDGSAELITSSSGNGVGEGGPNTWNIPESSTDEDMSDVEVVEVTKTTKNVLDNIALSDSEEETTGVVSTADLI